MQKKNRLLSQNFYNHNHNKIAEQIAIVQKKVNRGQSQGGVFYISIDDMAYVIGSEGFEYADILIDQLCNNIKDDLLKKNDVIYQIDIDHINIVLDGYTTAKLENLAQKIYNYIIDYGCKISSLSLQLSATIGACDFSKLTDNADDIISKAYLALKDALSQGEHFILYSDSKLYDVTSKHHMVLANYIQNAMLNNRLCLAYQPIVNIKTNKVEFYECLLRIKDDYGMANTVGPFIPIVEKMGFIDVIDSVALNLAINELKKYPNIILSVNVSSLTIQQTKWIDNAVRLLKDQNIAKRLILEITETSEYHDMESLMHFVKRLKKIGCKIAIDDFGTGYTSFAQIRSLPIDIIKIDGSFVKDMHVNKENFAFVEALAILGEKLKIKTLAEFVENEKILKSLNKMPIDYAQGHYYKAASCEKPWLTSNKRKNSK